MTRAVVVGAGAVGGALGTSLALAGRDVHLVARGAHGEAIRARGLTLRTPSREVHVRLPCTATLAEAGPADVVWLAVKAQDAEAALDGVARDATVVCLQNGVSTEPIAAGRVDRVVGAMTWIPAVHLEPGVVEVFADAPAAAFRLGRYQGEPSVDTLVADLVAAGFDAAAVPDVMRWKRGKLLTNLANVLDAYAVPDDGLEELARAAVVEAVRVLDAAGLPYVRRGALVRAMTTAIADGGTIGGRARPGGSTWQSAARGQPTEVDALNGWICRQGLEVGVPTPVNAAIVRLAALAPAPRSVPLAEIRALVERFR